MAAYPGTIFPAPPQGYAHGGAMLSATIDNPVTSRAKSLLPGFSCGAKGATVNPSPLTNAHLGRVAGLHGEVAWFERIHVIPRLYDLTFLLSEQEITVEVWNAFRYAGKSLTSLVVTGSVGLSVESPPTLPLWVPPLHEDTYILMADDQGDPQIDNLVTWTFTSVPVDGTNIEVIGSRLVPFPFMGNAADTMEEGLEFKTNILTAWDGTEQRIARKSQHRATQEMSVLCLDERESQHLNAILYGWRARVYGVPLWQYAERLSSLLNIGGATLVLPTTGVPWTAGDVLLLWSDPWTWEALTVDTLGSGQLEVTTGARALWPAGAWVCPIGMGRLLTAPNVVWESRGFASARPTFTMDRVTS